MSWFSKSKKNPGGSNKETGNLNKEPGRLNNETGKLNNNSNHELNNNAADNENSKTGFFKRLNDRLSRTRKSLTGGLDKIFPGKRELDDDLMEELEELLITSDIGVETSINLLQNITKKSRGAVDSDEVRKILKEEMISLLKPRKENNTEDNKETNDLSGSTPHVVMVVGVNGVGKTTTIGKLAAKAVSKNKKVLIAAADTFRAAAIEQLTIWAERAGADIIKHKENSDPAAVVFDSIEAGIARKADIIFIDTAGRLHTKVNLMEELKKIKRTVAKKMPGAPHEILLVLDATTGQNAMSQAKLFNEAVNISGIALTKLDGTAKGGIAVSLYNSLNIPLKYIGIGEKIEDLQDFNAELFINALF